MLLNCDTYGISSHNFNFKLETLCECAPIYRTFKLSIWTLYQLWQYPCAGMILLLIYRCIISFFLFVIVYLFLSSPPSFSWPWPWPCPWPRLLGIWNPTSMWRWPEISWSDTTGPKVYLSMYVEQLSLLNYLLCIYIQQFNYAEPWLFK